MNIKSELMVKRILFICLFLFLFFGCDNSDKKEIEKKASVEKISKKISIPSKKVHSKKDESKSISNVDRKIKKEKKVESEPEKVKSADKKINIKKEEAEPSSFIEGLLDDKVKSEKKEEESSPQADYYDPKGRVNPFQALIKDSPKKIKKPVKPKKPTRPKTPLEKLDLGQLKLVAVIATPQGDSAILEESSGKGYVVEIGTYVGLNSGQIVKIESDRIVIKETVEDITGKSIIKESILKIQKPVGE